MKIKITIVIDDGREEIVREYEDYGDAVGDAIELAHSKGFDRGDGHGPARLVRLYRRGLIELSLTVVRGGLKGVPKTT